MTIGGENRLRRAILVVCDGLRADMITPALTPNLCQFAKQAKTFRNHRGVFPSTTRTTSASIATGCQPRRHGLEGNCVALDEGEGLVAMSVGPPAFRDRLKRATGQTLRVPTLAQRLAGEGDCIVFSNVSPGAAIFQDPDGYGWMYHREVAYGPGRKGQAPLGVSHDANGDRVMTERFIGEIITERRPALAVLWQCEPDHTQHAQPLGSPAHLRAIAAADTSAGKVMEALSSSDDDTLLIVASDHGHETTGEIIPLETMLIEAGFKADVSSTDVVVASNGLSASIYIEETARGCLPDMLDFLKGDSRIEQVISGTALETVGHRADTPLAIAVTGRRTDETNEFGVPGIASAFEDPLSSDTLVGCGQHGGLSRFEQHPFLLIKGEGFEPGAAQDDVTSAVDIAPTILRHLEMPSDTMDGAPLQTISSLCR